MTTTDTLIDRIFDRRYVIKRKLGSGGMADVYLAEDQELGRRVALKLLNERHAADEQFVERFRREAQSAAGLNHPNIVSIFDRGRAEGTYYIAMEYLDGRTLKELLVRNGPTPIPIAIDYARQILGALSFAHRNGIVHRDIKPHNIVVGADGRLKVTDFGIARSGASQMTEAGSIVGTAQYLSPEQARGAPVDPRSDLYSLGIVLYEMLTGKVPFTGDTPVEIAMKHLSQVPEPPSKLRPEVPHDLDAVVMRALAKDPDQRYASAEEMDADLARVARGVAVSRETEDAMTQVLSGVGVADRADDGHAAARRRAAARAARLPRARRLLRLRGAAARPLDLAVAARARPDHRRRRSAAGSSTRRSRTSSTTTGRSPCPTCGCCSEDLAVQKIQQAGLKPRVVNAAERHRAEGPGHRRRTRPAAPKIGKGSTVTLTVSTGKPKVHGARRARPAASTDAVTALAQLGLNPKIVHVYSPRAGGHRHRRRSRRRATRSSRARRAHQRLARREAGRRCPT